MFRRGDLSKFKCVLRSARPPSEAFLLALAVLLAGLHAVLGVTATAGMAVTHDEIAHLTAGRAYNTLDDYRLQPENGVLPQRWTALPLSLLHPHYPPLAGNEAWRDADIWIFGHQFFYESGNETDLMLFVGRAMISLFSAGTGLLIFFWSRRLFGTCGAFLSLGLFVFCPGFLANGPLATSDVTMVFFLLASVTAWWWQLESPNWRRVLLSAVVFALACVAKFSAVLLLPMFVLLALLRLLRPPGGSRTRLEYTIRLAGAALAHAVCAWTVIWTFFGWRYSAFAPGLPPPLIDFNRPWTWVLEDSGFVGKVVLLARKLHALPEAFLYGFTFVFQFARQRGAFLNGEYSIYGWASFFPFTFLAKTTVPVLLLIATGLAAWIQRLVAAGAAWRERVRAQLWPLAPLLVLFVVYWLVSIGSHLNIGHRHILPTYPVVFILLGAFGSWLNRRRPAALVVVLALAGWHVGESLWIRPHYLAYFNELVGGPANGWRHLVDSSLDWGQDLPDLARWLRTHNSGAPREPVYLSYFGTGDPRYEGIAATRLPTLPNLPPKPPWYRLGPGLYCVSASMLQVVYGPIRGPWTKQLEAEYQHLHAIESTLLAYQSDPAKRRKLQHDVADQKWRAVWNRYDQLRFARLCFYLRARQPDAVIDYTIFVYRLSAEEIAWATDDSEEVWRAAIEQARTAAQR